MLPDWLNVWSISRRFIQYGEKTESSDTRLLISYYLYFLHAINIQRRCFIEFAVIITHSYFPLLRLVLTDFFNILKVFCEIILKEVFVTKSQDFLSCSHLDPLSFKAWRLIPNTTETKPRAIYTIFSCMHYFSWTNKGELLYASLPGSSGVFMWQCESSSFFSTVSCSHKHRLVSFRHLLSLMHCHSLCHVTLCLCSQTTNLNKT